MFIPWEHRRVGSSLGSGVLLKEFLLLEHLEPSGDNAASSTETVFIICPFQYSIFIPKVKKE